MEVSDIAKARVRWTPDTSNYFKRVARKDEGVVGTEDDEEVRDHRHSSMGETIFSDPAGRIPGEGVEQAGRYGAGRASASVNKNTRVRGSFGMGKTGMVAEVGMLPSLASSAAIQQIKRPLFTVFPGKPSVKESPPLLSKMEGIIKSSGLFGADGSPGQTSRGRLDVMRVVFALYCDSARVYRPILGMVQREYETHIAMYDTIKNRQSSLEDDLETGNDYYAQQTVEMKRRWKERLRKADAAVREWQDLYKQLEENVKHSEQHDRMRKEEVDEMEAKVKQVQAENASIFADNQRLAKECNKLSHDAGRTAQVEREKNQLDEQVALLTAQLADMKTQKEVQLVHVTSQMRDYNEQKRDATNMRKRADELEALSKTLTPRPDWSSISSNLLPQLELPITEGKTSIELAACMEQRIKASNNELGISRVGSQKLMRQASTASVGSTTQYNTN